MAIKWMSIGQDLPGLPYLQRMYWAVVGAAIAWATATNVLNMILSRQRLLQAQQGLSTPAKPKRFLLRAYATVTAIVREISYAASPPLLRVKRLNVTFLPLGLTLVVLANMIVLLVFCFYKLNTKDKWQWEDIGYRTGYVTVCQMPLIFLLAGKRNIIGFLTGSSYERLSCLHRWTARTLFLTATIHMGFWFASWDRFDYIMVKIKTDPITQQGLGAWVVLAWIVLSSLAPIRNWCYELFVLQHLLSFVAFTVMAYMHTPARHHVWIWIPVGLFAFDRLIRAGNLLYNSLSIFHPRRQGVEKRSRLWACKAQLTPLPHGITRLTIHNPPVHWTAGQHILLSCHSILPFQNHPFTISSLPEDGKIEALVRAQRGGTRRLLGHAEKIFTLPTVEARADADGRTTVTIEGPYGRIRPLRQFDSVVFFAGGVGATFIMPLMRELVGHWSQTTSSHANKPTLWGSIPGAVTRRIRLIWAVKSASHLFGFAGQLNKAWDDVAQLRAQGRDVRVDISIYVTCDDRFTDEQKSQTQTDCLSEPQAINTGNKTSDVQTKGMTPGMKPEKATSENTEGGSACGQGKSCCCKTVITDEDAIVAPCTCAGERIQLDPSTTSGSISTSSSIHKPTKEPVLHSNIALLSGRPHPRGIIRTALEEALGESAVVVCGPSGLAQSIRTSVVALSDERAVHKGTGAQGIWLHCEGFGY